MPIYEYDCRKCSQAFETLVFAADEVVKCPDCGSERVEKKFSVFGVGSSTASSSAGACGMPSSQSCPPAGCSMPDCSAFN